MPKGRLPQNVKNVPLMVSKPLALRDKIYKSTKKERLAGICLSEISQLFLCFKNYNFNEQACSKELQLFQNCYTQHETHFKDQSQSLAKDKKSVAAINKMLKKYSN